MYILSFSGYDKYDRDYYGGPPRRDERYYDYHRDPRDRERDRYYEDKDRHERDRYYEERDKYYDRRPPPGHYDRGKIFRIFKLWPIKVKLSLYK